MKYATDAKNPRDRMTDNVIVNKLKRAEPFEVGVSPAIFIFGDKCVIYQLFEKGYPCPRDNVVE